MYSYLDGDYETYGEISFKYLMGASNERANSGRKKNFHTNCDYEGVNAFGTAIKGVATIIYECKSNYKKFRVKEFVIVGSVRGEQVEKINSEWVKVVFVK
jgi:hypothetical protein